MKINLFGLLLCTALVGCGSGDAPFGNQNIDPDTGEPTIDGNGSRPPGTVSPSPNDSIFRSEPVDDSGSGFAQNVSYNAQDDTFSVDNLPFDGGASTPYTRSGPVQAFGDYAVYEAVDVFPDTLNQSPINQLPHRAIYGVSDTGQTEFAIIRTGAYVDYGFGGFLYERDGTVSVPTTGQGLYNGQGAGIRDYSGRGGLDYITADVQVIIDFDDFNVDSGTYEGAVDGFVFNKRVFDINGNDITNDTIARINAENDAALTAIPTTVFSIGPNALDANGEIGGEVTSPYGDAAGQLQDYATGQYYGILSGDNAQELVGIVVTESTQDSPGITVRDTVGFNIYR